MAPKLTLRYDRVGDILYVETCLPYATQESDELPDEVVGRYNPVTGELESVAILHFTHRFPRDVRGTRTAAVPLPSRVKDTRSGPPRGTSRRSTARVRRR